MVQLPFSGGGATFSPSWPPFAVVPLAVIAATAVSSTELSNMYELGRPMAASQNINTKETSFAS